MNLKHLAFAEYVFLCWLLAIWPVAFASIFVVIRTRTFIKCYQIQLTINDTMAIEYGVSTDFLVKRIVFLQ